jgi:hypothetical protein
MAPVQTTKTKDRLVLLSVVARAARAVSTLWGARAHLAAKTWRLTGVIEDGRRDEPAAHAHATGSALSSEVVPEGITASTPQGITHGPTKLDVLPTIEKREKKRYVLPAGHTSVTMV